ncbi:WD40 repeat domain-containing protein [Desulfococcaceae bacterium HSG7]|nr:WD40 repeat domain-containing protein [Desulfococcaceae bacterium HSG7]
MHQKRSKPTPTLRNITITLFIFVFALMGCSPMRSQNSQEPILQLDTGGHKAKINDVVFTPDGRYLISAGNDKLIRVWDTKTGKTVRTLRGQIGAGGEGKIYAMALSPDGQWLAAGGRLHRNRIEGSAIRLFHFPSGELRGLLKGHTNVVFALAFSSDSRMLVSGSFDKTAIIWDVAKQRRQHTLKGHTHHIYAVAFTPVNQPGRKLKPALLRVVTGSFDHTLKLWRVADGKLIKTMTGHTDKVHAVAVSPADGVIASGSYDHTIRLWNGKTGAYIKTLADQGTRVGSLSFSPDGRRLVSGIARGPNNYCHVWSVPDGKESVTYKGHDNIVIATAVSPDGRQAATGGGNNQEVHLWSLKSGKLHQRMAGKGANVWAVGFSDDGRQLVWGNTWAQHNPLNYGSMEYQLRLPDKKRGLGAPRTVKSVSAFMRARDTWQDWSLRHRKGGNYGLYAILDIRRGKRTVASIERGSTDGYDHRSYTFTPDGQHIISGGMGGVLTLYTRDGQKTGDYIGHTGDVWCVAVSPDGRLLASGSHDQTVRLWNLLTRENLLTLFHGTDGEWVAWTPTGHYTASPNGDRILGWHINRGVDKAADYVEAAQLKDKLHRPDIVDAAVRLRSVKKAVANAKR